MAEEKQKYRVLRSFEHYPLGWEPGSETDTVVPGDIVDDIHPDSIRGLLIEGRIEEAAANAKAKKAQSRGEVAQVSVVGSVTDAEGQTVTFSEEGAVAVGEDSQPLVEVVEVATEEAEN